MSALCRMQVNKALPGLAVALVISGIVLSSRVVAAEPESLVSLARNALDVAIQIAKIEDPAEISTNNLVWLAMTLDRLSEPRTVEILKIAEKAVVIADEQSLAKEKKIGIPINMGI